MTQAHLLAFSDPQALHILHACTAEALDTTRFGVIAFDAGGIIRRYNRHEEEVTGLKRERVMGCHVFTDIAQCMNNYLVAQKYEDAATANRALDEIMDFVLTWRMKPTPVALRLLRAPDVELQYLLLKRLS